MKDNYQPHKQPGETPDSHNYQLLLALSIIGRHNDVRHADFKEENLDNISTPALVQHLLPGTKAPNEG